MKGNRGLRYDASHQEDPVFDSQTGFELSLSTLVYSTIIHAHSVCEGSQSSRNHPQQQQKIIIIKQVKLTKAVDVS